MQATNLSASQVSRLETTLYYKHVELNVPKDWKLSRKHFRIVLQNGWFCKLNKFRNRLNKKDLRYYGVRFAPKHLYCSVVDWLFPERVGKKHKAYRAVPVGGEYFVDVDAYMGNKYHNHMVTGVCIDCLQISKRIAVLMCEVIEENYRRIQIVFSGRRGFHIHVFDFKVRDWTRSSMKNPVKRQHAARYKYTSQLAGRLPFFDRYHIIVSSDPLRVASLPYSLNGKTGLICLSVGNRKDLERTSITALLEKASITSHLLNMPGFMLTPSPMTLSLPANGG